MSGDRDLAELIASMEPQLDPATYVWVSVEELPEAVSPLATMREGEGLSAVCLLDEADAAGLEFTFPCARITLALNSSLEAVGLTAAFAAALGKAGISANVVAGYHHDHVFVPLDRAQDAMMALNWLAASTQK